MGAAGTHGIRRGDGVLVVGSTSVDLTAFARRLPGPGETVLGEAFTSVLGGKGANQAVAAARAGASTRFVACVGDDPFAAVVESGLRDAGVDLSHLHRLAGATGVAHIRVDAAGENDIVVVPNANAALEPAHVDAALGDDGDRSGALLVQLESPLATVAHAVRRGREAGLVVVLDPAPAQPLDDGLWAHVDVVTPNETEAAMLTGVRVDDAAGAEAAARWFLARGVGAAVVTLAGEGALVVDASGARRLAPFRVDAVDTTAAGDAFAGALAAALAAGATLDGAARRAAAAGALAVTRRGASPSIPTAAEVDALLARG